MNSFVRKRNYSLHLCCRVIVIVVIIINNNQPFTTTMMQQRCNTLVGIDRNENVLFAILSIVMVFISKFYDRRIII